jgi:hypothetical protein
LELFFFLGLSQVAQSLKKWETLYVDCLRQNLDTGTHINAYSHTCHSSKESFLQEMTEFEHLQNSNVAINRFGTLR